MDISVHRCFYACMTRQCLKDLQLHTAFNRSRGVKRAYRIAQYQSRPMSARSGENVNVICCADGLCVSNATHWVLVNQVVATFSALQVFTHCVLLSRRGKRAYRNNIIITDKIFPLKLFFANNLLPTNFQIFQLSLLGRLQ